MVRHRIYLILIFLTWFQQPLLVSAQGSIESDTAVSSFAQIQFERSEHNFGDVRQGEIAEYVFFFKNIGNTPLVFFNVLSTCGCTVPDWPKEPIMPGGKGNIKVVFDSSSKIGRQNKVITIRSNARSGDYRLRISAMVLPTDKKKK